MSLDLPERFLPPKGWRTHSFTNPETGHKIHYGSVFPQDGGPPSAVIVCLGGLSEFSEKYYELAHDMLARGYAFWFIDWHYQGRSGRLTGTPQRRHSDGFEADVSDLHKLVSDYIKPSSVHPDRGRIPMIMIGHSMGAHIGLLFLKHYPQFFVGAAFSAPFFGIYNFTWPMRLLATLIAPLVPMVGRLYVFGGHDWRESSRKSDGSDIFSHDIMRDTLHNLWSKSDPDLRVGSVTFGWVIKALKSCAAITVPRFLDNVKIPVLLALASEDRIVDNKAIRVTAARLPNATLLEIEGAHHEILMEDDVYREQFLTAFDKMVKQHKLASEDNIKPF